MVANQLKYVIIVEVSLNLTELHSNHFCNLTYRLEKPIKSVGGCLDLIGCRASTIKTDLQSDKYGKNGMRVRLRP